METTHTRKERERGREAGREGRGERKRGERERERERERESGKRKREGEGETHSESLALWKNHQMEITLADCQGAAEIFALRINVDASLQLGGFKTMAISPAVASNGVPLDITSIHLTTQVPR